MIDGEQIVFNALNPIISIGVTYGIFKKGKERLEISNKIFEDIIYSYMISKIRTSASNMSLYNIKSKFIKENGELNIEKILKKFQQFMKEQYSAKDEEFYINKTLNDFDNYTNSKYYRNIEELSQTEQIAFFNDFLKETPLP